MIGIQNSIYSAVVRSMRPAICLGFAIVACATMARAQASSPAALRVDELVTPLGIDDAQPRFSWQLQDNRQGARQTAYRVLVASTPELLAESKPDVGQRADRQRAVGRRSLCRTRNCSGHALFLEGPGVGSGRQASAREPDQLVGVGVVKAAMARAVDRL